MKKVLSSLFLFAFIIVFSNVSMVYASTSNTKTIKTPSSVLSDYAKKMEQKETQITKKQEERQKALEKAKKERQKKIEEQKKAAQKRQQQRQQNINNIKNNANSLKNSFKLK